MTRKKLVEITERPEEPVAGAEPSAMSALLAGFDKAPALVAKANAMRDEVSAHIPQAEAALQEAEAVIAQHALLLVTMRGWEANLPDLQALASATLEPEIVRRFNSIPDLLKGLQGVSSARSELQDITQAQHGFRALIELHGENTAAREKNRMITRLKNTLNMPPRVHQICGQLEEIREASERWVIRRKLVGEEVIMTTMAPPKGDPDHPNAPRPTEYAAWDVSTRQPVPKPKRATEPFSIESRIPLKDEEPDNE